MKAERLLILADFLETVPPDRFDMSAWADRGFIEDECGTAACAAGWATRVFPELTMRVNPQYNMLEPQLQDGSRRSWAALMDFFGLETGEAFYIFDDGEYVPASDPDPDDSWITPRMVADRIREIVATGKKNPPDR